MRLLYISHKVTNPDPTLQAKNLEGAGLWADRLFRQGFICYGPWNVREAPPYATDQEAWDHAMAQCLPLVDLCDALFMAPTTPAHDHNRPSCSTKADYLWRDLGGRRTA